MVKSVARSKLGFLMFTMILAASLSIIVSSGMKEVFEIPRVCEGIEGCPESFAFPSRHASAGFAIAAVFALYNKNYALRVIVFVGAGLLAYSRIYLGVHTIPDIVVGAVVGIVVGVTVHYLVKLRHKGHRH